MIWLVILGGFQGIHTFCSILKMLTTKGFKHYVLLTLRKLYSEMVYSYFEALHAKTKPDGLLLQSIPSSIILCSGNDVTWCCGKVRVHFASFQQKSSAKIAKYAVEHDVTAMFSHLHTYTYVCMSPYK